MVSARARVSPAVRPAVIVIVAPEAWLLSLSDRVNWLLSATGLSFSRKLADALALLLITGFWLTPTTPTVLVTAVLHWGVSPSLLASNTFQLIVRLPLAGRLLELLP